MVLYTNRDRVPFLIDEEFEEKVSSKTWWITNKGYVETRFTPIRNEGQIRLFLHQFLFGKAPLDLQWDHIDRDKLNNQRPNLRVVTSSKNNLNKGHLHKYGFRGIDLHRTKWRGYVRSEGKTFYTPCFTDIEQAVKERQCLQIKLGVVDVESNS